MAYVSFLFSFGMVVWYYLFTHHLKFQYGISYYAIRIHILAGSLEFLWLFIQFYNHHIVDDFSENLEEYWLGNIGLLVGYFIDFFHMASCLAMFPNLFGQRFIMEAGYSFAIGLKHLSWIITLFIGWNIKDNQFGYNYDDINRHSWNVFWFHSIFGWVRMIYIIFRVYRIFPKHQYTASVLVAGMTLFPFPLGACAMLYFLAYCILYYYVRGWFIPWKSDDFIEHSREVDFRKLAMSSESNREMICKYLHEHPPLNMWARLCQPKTKISFDEKLIFMFNLFDPDRSGCISRKEFSDFFVEFGVQQCVIETTFKSFDHDEDGLIKFEEFNTALAKGSKMIQSGFDGFLHDIRLDHGLLEYIESWNAQAKEASISAGAIQSIKTVEEKTVIVNDPGTAETSVGLQLSDNNMELQKQDLAALEKEKPWGNRCPSKSPSITQPYVKPLGTLFNCFCPPMDDLDSTVKLHLDSVTLDVE